MLPNLHDHQTYDQIVARIMTLRPDSTGQWGKMSVSQMFMHCRLALLPAVYNEQRKQTIVGFLLARFLKPGYMNEKPLPHNSPTDPSLKISEEADFEDQKAKLLFTLKQFHDRGPAGAEGKVSSFWGKLSAADWARIQYKHLNHHLLQFGA